MNHACLRTTTTLRRKSTLDLSPIHIDLSKGTQKSHTLLSICRLREHDLHFLCVFSSLCNKNTFRLRELWSCVQCYLFTKNIIVCQLCPLWALTYRNDLAARTFFMMGGRPEPQCQAALKQIRKGAAWQHDSTSLYTKNYF